MLKRFEDRKNTIGVSLSNGTLIALEDYCERTGVTRSMVIETLLKTMLKTEEDLDRILDNEVLHYEED